MTFHKFGTGLTFLFKLSKSLYLYSHFNLPAKQHGESESRESLEPQHQHHRVHTTTTLVILFSIQFFGYSHVRFPKKLLLHFLHNLKLFWCVGLSAAEAGKLLFVTGEGQEADDSNIQISHALVRYRYNSKSPHLIQRTGA